MQKQVAKQAILGCNIIDFRAQYDADRNVK